MITAATQTKPVNTEIFTAEIKNEFETPKKIAVYLEATFKHHDFGYYVKSAQTKFKNKLLHNTIREVEKTLNHFTMGYITNNEKDNRIADIWLHANCQLTMFMVKNPMQFSSPYHYTSFS